MPREKPGLIASALSREEHAASAASEGSLAYGFFQPITVAGPRPIFTAFPAAHACKLKIECMSRIAVCQRVNKLLLLKICRPFAFRISTTRQPSLSDRSEERRVGK